MSIVKSAWLKAGISLVLWPGLILSVAASEVRTLKYIEVTSLENISQLRLEFDEDLLGDPVINFESGALSLLFNSAKIDPALPFLTTIKEDLFIKAIRAVEVPDSDIVHLDILPNSARVDLGHPEINHVGNNLMVVIPGKMLANPALSNTTLLTNEIGQRVKSDSSFPSTFSKGELEGIVSDQPGFSAIPSQDWVETMVSLVLALFFVLILIYLIAYIYNRFFSGRFSSMQGKISVRQVSSYHVGPKQKIVVFEMSGRLFACGVTPTSINLIAELNDEKDQEYLHSAETDEETNEINMDHMQADYLKTLAQKNGEGGFKETLSETMEADSTSIELEGHNNGVFLKANSIGNRSVSEKNDKSYRSLVPSRSHTSKTANKSEKILYGNQMMQDFSKKLLDRLKFLKPIK